MENKTITLGIDIGSTTAKLVAARDGEIIYSKYERHMSRVRQKTVEMLREMRDAIGNVHIKAAISGSAGLGVAEAADIPFIQEVAATTELVSRLHPETEAVIELGGEDAKIIFFGSGIDERMNGTCAGGTGAFIDQMATLLGVTADELDELSLNASRIYPIASRCGVFAKTDIQPLLNQGARHEDIAASIYQAVVNQTIAGLAQGRRITGQVLFLGGPLTFCKGLRYRFRKTLGLDEATAAAPPYSSHSVAYGATFFAEESGLETTPDELCERITSAGNIKTAVSVLPPLFSSEAEYEIFRQRHERAAVKTVSPETYAGNAYVGIDCGSTTTKLVLISNDRDILYTYYSSNKGNPVEVVKEQLIHIHELCGDRIKICGTAVTGYGEELIKNAFGIDIGLVETVAHYTAARHFMPDVDFILDIGGQDIKCFKIKNGAIDSIMLNEACSSGCGSFIETFARSMGYTSPEFARLALYAEHPVNLGSRCTVFMNSSVKQSQKDGATAEDISAGLSISVVKNAIYKVIRASNPEELGRHVVVQGGTFMNDAVLRAFECELGCEVVRPAIAGLMGAYGAAIRAMGLHGTTLMSKDELLHFEHTAKAATCKGCANSCRLTVNTFSGGRRFISGNRCERPLHKDGEYKEQKYNLYRYKREYLTSLTENDGDVFSRCSIGIPMALGIFETAPLWHGIFRSLGFKVKFSGMSTRRTYEKGQFTIPSDTACYPAKIMHGHIEELISDGADLIFYPCLTYNVKEAGSNNHYNCPVVAYYSELLNGNLENTGTSRFFYPYLNINDKKELVRGLARSLEEIGYKIKPSEIKAAVDEGFAEYDKYMESVRRQGELAIDHARRHGRRVMILAGRPYHIDEEICHGIDKLAATLGFTVVSEDSVCHLADAPETKVLNQWTYHSRLYRAAAFAVKNPDVELVQLVSFGCGVDAITTDEVRRILESGGKYCTQIKIDEITNLGAVRIRLRSLLAALDEGDAD